MIVLSQALNDALEHHRAGRFAQAEKLYRQILQADPNNVDALHLLGMIAHEAGRNDFAIDYIRRAIALRPDSPSYHSNLGLAYQSAGQAEQAIESFHEALRLKPDYPEAHINLGAVLKSLGRLEEARSAFQEALRLRPDFAEAHSNLGQVLLLQGNVDAAFGSFREALRLKPELAEAHYNLASAFEARHRTADQIASLREAVRIRPKYAEAQSRLGLALTSEGQLEDALPHLQAWLWLLPGDPRARAHLQETLRTLGRSDEAEAIARLPEPSTSAASSSAGTLTSEQAIAHKERGDSLLRAGLVARAVEAYRQAVEVKPDYANAFNDLGNALQQQGQLDEAIAAYSRALEIEPNHAPAHSNLGVYFKDQGRLEEAAVHLRAALAARPSDTVRVLLATLLPPVYQSQADVEEWRRRLVENLRNLRDENIKLDPSREVVPNLFYLAYQGFNDRDIQRDLAQLCAAGMTHEAPPAQRVRSAGGRIRLGMLSKYLKNHTIGMLMRGVIAKLSREAFEVIVLAFEQPRDPVAEFIRQHGDRYIVLPANVVEARRMVAELDLDVLFYPDVGMDPTTYSLAFSRLAPVQCATWGHPLTTGIPVMDYFLSSELIEPEDAGEHYTETLIRLKTLPFYYYRPVAPEPLKDRGHFSLPADQHVYACLQTLFKFHPRFDEVLGGILRGDPNGALVMIRGKHQHWQDMLLRRWSVTLPDVLDRVHLVPPQPREDFLNLMTVSDVLLDTFPFSGGNTSYEGLALGVPIVTLAAEYMRGRITCALYKKMGIMDCVATTPQEYIERALELGTQPARREEMRSRILAANHVLFEDMEAVRELEAFLRQAVEKARARSVSR